MLCCQLFIRWTVCCLFVSVGKWFWTDSNKSLQCNDKQIGQGQNTFYTVELLLVQSCNVCIQVYRCSTALTVNARNSTQQYGSTPSDLYYYSWNAVVFRLHPALADDNYCIKHRKYILRERRKSWFYIQNMSHYLKII